MPKSSRNNAKKPQSQPMYDALRLHTRTRKDEPKKRINILLPESVYERLLDICISNQTLMTEWIIDKINRTWVNRARIINRDFTGTDREYMEQHPPKRHGRTSVQEDLFPSTDVK